MTEINNLFDCINFKLFGITFTAHGHRSAAFGGRLRVVPMFGKMDHPLKK